MKISSRTKILVGSVLVAGSFTLAYATFTQANKVAYTSPAPVMAENVPAAPTPAEVAVHEEEAPVAPRHTGTEVFLSPVTHVATPAAVKSIYMSQCVAGTPSFRARLVDLVDTTELNSIIIDIRDYSGMISFQTDNPVLADMVSDSCGARDMRAFIKQLHEKNIYVIGRITVFQNPYYTKVHPEEAVQKIGGLPGQGGVWKDDKGLAFVDVGSKPYWDTVVTLGEVAYTEVGFDELNFDYVRYPSDGPMDQALYTWSTEKPKADMLEDFFKYLHAKLEPTGAVLSVDLFGMVATNTDDLGIGQVLERALPYFDYVSPMVYPSHYPPNWNGFKNPATHPYDVVHIAMTSAVMRTKAAGYDIQKIRPWLQDFDMGASYTAEMVRAQMQATYDAGLTSWLLWDAGNTYTKAALKSE